MNLVRYKSQYAYYSRIIIIEVNYHLYLFCSSNLIRVILTIQIYGISIECHFQIFCKYSSNN